MAPVDKKILMKASRERLKANKDKYQQHLIRERERDKRRRQLNKIREEENEEILAERRKKVLERVRNHRKKLKANSSTSVNISPIGSYKCRQSFGKAVNRLKKNLPNSPSKTSAIVKKLALDVGLNLREDNKVNNLPHRVLPEHHKKCITDFYCSDTISRQAPGKNDVKSIKCPKTGKRVHMQIRHLIMTIKEAFQQFSSKYPDIKVKKSLFFSLRPKHVLPVSQMPHNVCVCKYHSNINFLLESISKVVPAFPRNHKELLQYMCCNISNESCMLNKCSTCSTRQASDLLIDFDEEKEISWKKWIEEGGIHLIVSTGSLKEALNELESKISHFKYHCYVKKIQEDYFETSKNNLNKEKGTETYAVVQIDFAENYSITFQDEIQSAHWSHQQVGIFTSCAWLPNNVTKSYTVVSNDTSHSKFCVWTFLAKIVHDIKENFSFIDKLVIFSDNCAAQFKSKYTMSALCKMESDFKVAIEWNFFASSHGKGAVDGIGGTVKRHAWMAVKGDRNIHLESARDFHNHIVNKVHGVKSFYVDKSEVDQSILQNYWEGVIAIPNIQSCHHFRVYDSKNLLIARTSTSLMTKVPVFHEIESDNLDSDTELATRTRLRYQDVYSDCTSDEEATMQSPKLPVSGFQSPEEVLSGMYILVEVPCENGKGRKLREGKMYRYAAICQGGVDDENFVTVMFLKSHGSSNKTFIADDEDIKHVSFKNILGRLPNPSVKPKGLFTILYEFNGEIDVLEK